MPHTLDALKIELLYIIRTFLYGKCERVYVYWAASGRYAFSGEKLFFTELWLYWIMKKSAAHITIVVWMEHEYR